MWLGDARRYATTSSSPTDGSPRPVLKLNAQRRPNQCPSRNLDSTTIGGASTRRRAKKGGCRACYRPERKAGHLPQRSRRQSCPFKLAGASSRPTWHPRSARAGRRAGGHRVDGRTAIIDPAVPSKRQAAGPPGHGGHRWSGVCNHCERRGAPPPPPPARPPTGRRARPPRPHHAGWVEFCPSNATAWNEKKNRQRPGPKLGRQGAPCDDVGFLIPNQEPHGASGRGVPARLALIGGPNSTRLAALTCTAAVPSASTSSAEAVAPATRARARPCFRGGRHGRPRSGRQAGRRRAGRRRAGRRRAGRRRAGRCHRRWLRWLCQPRRRQRGGGGDGGAGIVARRARVAAAGRGPRRHAGASRPAMPPRPSHLLFGQMGRRRRASGGGSAVRRTRRRTLLTPDGRPGSGACRRRRSPPRGQTVGARASPSRPPPADDEAPPSCARALGGGSGDRPTGVGGG